MRPAVVAAALAAALPVVAGPAAAASFDAFATFDGTQGSGNFFYGTINPGDFTDSPQFLSSCDIGDACLTVANPVALTPLVFKSATAFSLGTVIVPDDRLVVHPGEPENLAVAVIFAVPTTASYRIDTVFSVQDVRPSGVGVSRFFNPFGNGLADATLTPVTLLNGGTPTFSDSQIVLLTAGDLFGFVVDRQGNFSNDATGLGFTVTSVPEPASWALMIAGFGLVGAAMRRRSVVAG